MKHGNAFVRGISALLYVAILLGMGALPAFAAADPTPTVKGVFVTFDAVFKNGNEIPYTYSFTSDPQTSSRDFDR